MMHAGAISDPLVDGFRSRVVATAGQRREQALASVRLVLAMGFAVYLAGTVARPYTSLAYRSLFIYVVYSALLLVLLHLRHDSTPALRFCIHAVDTLWAALILWLAASAASGFWLTWSPTSGLLFENVFFLFVLLAAAYRWGLSGTLATSGVWTVLLVAPAILDSFGVGRIGVLLPPQPQSRPFVADALSLFVIACVLGYVRGSENQLRANASRIAQLLGKAHSEAGFRETMQAVLGTLMDLFDTDRAVLAVRQAGSSRAFLWEAERRKGTQETVVRLSELESFQRQRYFFAAPGHTFYAVRRPLPHRGDKQFQLLAQGAESERLSNIAYSFPDYFLTWHPFNSLLGAEVALSEREEWCGRLFLFDPRIGVGREREVRFLRELVQEVGPAVYNAYRMRRLRSRAMSMERARIARELHDGVIQTLIGMEMEIAVLRRKAAGDPARVADELRRIHARLREEILGVRDLIRRVKPIELDGRQFPDSLGLIVDKFRRDTGISARFVSEVQHIAVPLSLVYEVTRIVQEALVNVRKHSHARSVLVRFAAEDGVWKLVIEDDGRGFEFSGRLSQAELDTTRRGPLVLKERVRSIGGELAIESVPGHGARLEIALPQKAYRYEEVHG
jgi:signal transduction histidine kinase